VRRAIRCSESIITPKGRKAAAWGKGYAAVAGDRSRNNLFGLWKYSCSHCPRVPGIQPVSWPAVFEYTDLGHRSEPERRVSSMRRTLNLATCGRCFCRRGAFSGTPNDGVPKQHRDLLLDKTRTGLILLSGRAEGDVRATCCKAACAIAVTELSNSGHA